VISPHGAARVFEAGDPKLHTKVGARADSGIATTGTLGDLVYGPYAATACGRYRARIHGSAIAPTDGLTVDAAAVAGTRQLAKAFIPLDGGPFCHEFSFEVPPPGLPDLEIRIAVTEKTNASIKRIEIVPEADEFGIVASLVSTVFVSGGFDPTRREHAVCVIFAALISHSSNSVELSALSHADVNAAVERVTKSNEHWEALARSRFAEDVRLVYRTVANVEPTVDDLRRWQSVASLGRDSAMGWLLTTAVNRRLSPRAGASATNGFVSSVVFVSDAKKERDSLDPVAHALSAKRPDFLTRRLTLDECLRSLGESAHPNSILVVASEHVDRVLRAAGASARFVYMEHGTAPLKTYTYADHYRRYDYSLLPGQLWVDRLERLYPELKGRAFAIGYPKLRYRPATREERVAYATAHGLDAERPIVLFAPTWTVRNHAYDTGIFNIRYLARVKNLVAIPHDGDADIANRLKTEFPMMKVLPGGETISEHYAFADILISDVSSTAIEFARIGKPVVCVKLPHMPDYDRAFLGDDAVPNIPHTSSRWDFCLLVPPDEVVAALHSVIDGWRPEAPLASAASEVIAMCRALGDEALELAVNRLEAIAETGAQHA
jgi:hypothetical protein